MTLVCDRQHLGSTSHYSMKESKITTLTLEEEAEGCATVWRNEVKLPLFFFFEEGKEVQNVCDWHLNSTQILSSDMKATNMASSQMFYDLGI